MKWMPLTDDALKQLQRSGYTHLIIKNVLLRGETDREYVTLEAVKNYTQNDSEAFAIVSDMAEIFLHSHDADYYVLFR